MSKRIKIILNGNPVNNAYFQVFVQVVDMAQTTYFSIVFGTGGSTVPIGVDVNTTATNLKNHLSAATGIPSYFSFSKSANEVYIDVNPTNASDGNIIVNLSSSAGISIQIIYPFPTVLVSPLKTALLRSTYSLRTIPNTPFDRAELQLFIWTGDIDTPPDAPNYNLSKPVVQLGQSVINFDVNHLLKAFVETSISNYMLSGLQPSNYNSSCWAKYVVSCFSSGSNVYEITGKIFGLYGYGEFSIGFNPQLSSNVLITGDNHRYFANQDSRLYFIKSELVSLIINGVTVTVAGSETVNYEYLQSVNLKDYAAVNEKIIVEFNYNTETRTITFELDCEIKYSVINCVFINRYGVPQSIFLSKVSKHGDDADSDEYRGLSSNFGVYDTTQHQYKEFNKNGRGRTVCNTTNLNEHENNGLKELLYSEQVWLIDSGVISPVKLNKNSFDYKTDLNDKQIQYTIEFKNAFDTINQVY